MEFIQSVPEAQPDFNKDEFFDAFIKNPVKFNYSIFSELTQENRYDIFTTILEKGPIETPYFARLLSNLFRTVKLPYYEEGPIPIIERMFEIFHITLAMIDLHENIEERCTLEVDYEFSVVDFFTKLLENNAFTYTDEIKEEYDEIILRSDLIDILGHNPEFIASKELVAEGITSNRLVNKFIQSRIGLNDIFLRATTTDTLLGLLSCSEYSPDAVNILIDSFYETEYMYIFTSDFYEAFARIVNIYMDMNEGTDIIVKLVRIVTMLVNSNTPINEIDYEIAKGINGNEELIGAIFEFSRYIDQQNVAEADPEKHLPGIGKQTFFRFAVYAFIGNAFEDVTKLFASEDENAIFVGIVLMILRKDNNVFNLKINHAIGGKLLAQDVFGFLKTISRSENQTIWTRPLAEMLVADPQMFEDAHFGSVFDIDEFAFEDYHLVDRYAAYIIDNIESLTQSRDMILRVLNSAQIKTPTILKVMAMLS